MLQYNSTIAVKLKICEGCGIPSKIFSTKTGKKLCHTCATQNRKPIAKMSDKRMDSLQNDELQGLIEDCDLVFSKLIRIKYADNKGIVACYTCEAEKRYQDMQCGHFIPRGNLATRFLPENARPQCIGCNCLAHGKMDIFERKLNEENNSIVEWLREQGNSIYKPSRFELKELLVELRNKLRIVQSKLNH